VKEQSRSVAESPKLQSDSQRSSKLDAHPDRVDLEADPLLDQEVEKLRAKIERLESEDKQLKEKIDSTNASISTYMSEMSNVIDSVDLASFDLAPLNQSSSAQ